MKTWYEITKLAGNCTFYQFAQAIRELNYPGRQQHGRGDRLWSDKEVREIVEQIQSANHQKR